MTFKTIELELPWPPTGNSSTRHTKSGIHYKTSKAVAYRAAVAQLLGWKGLGTKPLEGPLQLYWLLAPPDRRARDVDNTRKEAADALTLGRLWVDDSNKVIREECFVWTDPIKDGKIFLTITVGDLT
jgi:crossover junction endodeoxyribonuclease RusA